MFRKIIITVIILISSFAYAGERRYFDQYSNEITKEQYQQLIQSWYANLKKSAVTPVPSEIVQTAAPVPASADTPITAITSTPVVNIPKDSFGRPLKDAEGRWITYPGQEGYGSTMRSYTTEKPLDMTRDVRVRGHYRTTSTGKKVWVREHTRSK
ncbi:MAG: hypothetical protein R2941_17485 [Desulfobacterales bacterium]